MEQNWRERRIFLQNSCYVWSFIDRMIIAFIEKMHISFKIYVSSFCHFYKHWIQWFWEHFWAVIKSVTSIPGCYSYAADFKIMILVSYFLFSRFLCVFWSRILSVVVFIVPAYLLLSTCSELNGNCLVSCQLWLLTAHLYQCSCDSPVRSESSEMKPCSLLSAAEHGDSANYK